MTRPARFLWNYRPNGNVAHIWGPPGDHRVRPSECEEALADPQVWVTRTRPSTTGEVRWSAVGRTAGGRVLRVIYTIRRLRGRGGRATGSPGPLAYNVATAYDPKPGQLRGYPADHANTPPPPGSLL